VTLPWGRSIDPRKLGAIATVLVFGASLAGCTDVAIDVEVTSDTTAQLTRSYSMAAEYYANEKKNRENRADGRNYADSNPFCGDAVISENADGSATCTDAMEGSFDDVAADFDQGESAISFVAAGPGLVRVGLDTVKVIAGIHKLAPLDQADEETRAFFDTALAGRTFAIRISGEEIAETNMELSSDRETAEVVVPLLDLLYGRAELPDPLYAVVRAP
jgi:hypothetical protein